MSYFASWRQKRNLSIFFVWVCTIISFDHTFKLLWNKGDIVAVSFRFLTHIEWPCGSVYLLIYLQFGDRYFNTDFRGVRFRPVNGSSGTVLKNLSRARLKDREFTAIKLRMSLGKVLNNFEPWIGTKASLTFVSLPERFRFGDITHLRPSLTCIRDLTHDLILGQCPSSIFQMYMIW